MTFRPAIASMSLGRAWHHQLSDKFAAAAAAGLPGIEIFFEDLEYLAATFPGGNTPSNQKLAAQQTKDLCDSLNLEIIALGPFKDCEGILSATARASKFEELNVWFEIGHILDTDIIQIPCTFLTEGVTGDLNIVSRDLREIADRGAAQNPPFKFAYENLCWGTFNDTWSKAWAVVKAVDRANFGLCLDTYNIAGREWADPTSPDRCVKNADATFRASLAQMVKEIDVRKVFYVQVVDAERLDGILNEKHAFHVEGQKPRMSWSRNARLFICEEERGGYLPVVDVLRAICEGLGYEGWISMELFNRSLTREEREVPVEHANRAMESWGRLTEAMGWDEGKSFEIPNEDSKTDNSSFHIEQVEISARL